MATLKRIKKGGNSRWVIQGAAVNDSFIVPRGMRIRYIATDLQSALGGACNFTVGSTPNTFTVTNVTVSSVASATAGTLTIGGGATGTVTLVAGDITSTAGVAAKIAASTFAGWVVTVNGSVVTFTGQVGGQSAVTCVLGTATNITFSVTTPTTGTATVDIVAAAAMGTTKGKVTAYTVVADKDYVSNASSDYSTFLMTVSSASAGTINICGYSFTLTSGNVATANALASAIAAFVVPGYTLSANTATVTITKSANGIGLATPSIVLGSASGIGWTQTNYNADQTYYVGFSNAYGPGNSNVYVQLEKMN